MRYSTRYRLVAHPSARVARRAWTEFSRSGYGLYNVCAAIGYDFKHHDALEDAKAAGQVLLAAMRETGIDLSGWMKRVRQLIYGSTIAQVGNSEGPLHGEVTVFTGALEMTRAEAALMAAKIGCTVAAGVTKGNDHSCCWQPGRPKACRIREEFQAQKSREPDSKGKGNKNHYREGFRRSGALIDRSLIWDWTQGIRLSSHRPPERHDNALSILGLERYVPRNAVATGHRFPHGCVVRHAETDPATRVRCAESSVIRAP